MICYNVENARKAFNGLAESLDAVSRLPLSGSAWKSNADMKRDIANTIDLYPDADRIRAPFERAIEIANTARDEGTATALRKLLADLLTAHEKLTRGEKTENAYKAQLADVAASVRGLLADIAEDGTKRTNTAQTPEKVTIELHPRICKLLIDTKKAAQKMKLKFMCDGCRSVIRDGNEGFDAGEYFAGVMARREYGRRGHVGPCRLESWTEDGSCGEYDAFIGVSNGNGMSGHNIRFSVITERVEA